MKTGVRCQVSGVRKCAFFSSVPQFLNSSIPLLTLLCLVAACGFHPLHSKTYQESLAVNLSQVAIATDNSRLGQLLKAEIQDQVNPISEQRKAAYRLQITTSELDIPLFINRDGTSGRGDLRISSQYSLVRLSDSKAVANGNINRLASYSTSQNADYASFVSKEDSRQRAIMELAQDYKLRLANLLPLVNNPAAAEVAPPTPPAPILAPTIPGPHEARRPGV